MKIPKIPTFLLMLISITIPACHQHEDHSEGKRKIVVTSPKAKDVIVTQQFVCQIHSKRHIKVRVLMNGYLEEIKVKEGQMVKEGSVLFKVIPVLYKARLDAKKAEAELARLELSYTKTLFDKNVVAQQEVALYDAKLAKATAEVELAKAEFNFTEVRAYFDGIIDRLYEMQGSLVKEGEVLTTLSDNTVMWVYFNVPEKHYLEYMAMSTKEKESQRIDLQLANGTKFPQAAVSLRIEAKFNNETGTIPFRADFPNPGRLLRHGMTGNILVHRTLKNAIVIPQRATFEILAKRYVFVIDKDDVARQREVVIQHEQQDVFVIQSGIGVDDKIIYEGVRQVRDGDKVEFEFRPPDKILGHQGNHAE